MTFPSFSGNLSAPEQDAKALFFNDRSGSLFVRATAGDLEVIEKAIQVLNAVPPQVQVEVKIVEMDADDSKELGIDWFLGNTSVEVATATSGGVGGVSPQSGGTSAVPAAASTRLTGILTGGQFPTWLRRLQERPGVDLLSAPRITTLSGRQARVSMTEPKDVPDPSTGTTRSVGFGPVLDVIPMVLADGVTIQLTVVASVSEYLAPDAQSALVPRMRATTLQASAVVWDGQTLVLSGDLVTGPVKVGADGRPERAESSDPTPANGRRRLLMFVTPTLIDPAGQRLHHPDSLPFDPNSVPPQPK